MTDPRRDTICALATPPGESGLAVVRVSGEEAREVLSQRFAREAGGSPAPPPEAGRAAHGYFLGAGGEAVDEVVLVLYRAPRSYTGEDMAEISCHGSMQVVEEVLEALCSAGARVAEPGEFTRRAFLNGKIDLPQAEAVADLIESRSALARRVALEGLTGALGRQVRATAAGLLDLLADVEASIDFAEEDVELFSREELAERARRALGQVRDLRATSRQGRRLRSGVRVALVGAPNVGKSSLFNRLLGEERAIVTEIPGTTRDRLREAITLGGYPLLLEDTAGLRSEPEEIEAIGLQGTLEAMREADLLIVVLDASRPAGEEEAAAWSEVDPSRAFLALNKIDLGHRLASGEAAGRLGVESSRVFPVSALEGTGVGELHRALARYLGGDEASAAAGIRVAVNARQDALLAGAGSGLEGLIESLGSGEPPEVLALDLRTALEALEEITGERISDDVLGRIFERFCVGK
jgi:tRNA modification GTPase